MLKEYDSRFWAVSKTFHWLMFVLISVQLYLIWTFETIAQTDPTRGNYMFLHKSVGVTILLVALLWIVWRWFNVLPKALPDARSWQHYLAKATHTLLLIGIVLMPLSGILMSMTAGRGVDWFGIYTFTAPAFIPQNEILAGRFKAAHEVVAFALIGLVALHALGALVHHFIYKDTVLKRMLP